MTQPPPQYGEQPPQYGARPPGHGDYPPQAPPTNTMAVIGLVCAFLFPPAGLVCGIVARRQIKHTGEQGDGLALAAIIISILSIVILVIALGFVIASLLFVADVVSHFPTPSPYVS